MAVLGKREGTHKGCPYGGLRRVDVCGDGGPGQARGHPQGVPLRGLRRVEVGGDGGAGQARGVPIRGVDRAGGTGFGWTPSIRHLL